VWLYDEAHLEAIRHAGPPESGHGGMPPGFEASTAAGLIVGYGLLQDDDVDVEVHVGRPFTKKELSGGRWLEPQRAYLRLPSGRLRIESNDASRVGPEEPGAEGVTVEVAPGDYRLTLLRADHEALVRDGVEWTGAQELILLEPGGTMADAARDILPFEHRRDLDWVGKHRIDGSRADALVWFEDALDSFFINLDRPALTEMGLLPGGYLRTQVPDAELTLVTAFHDSWREAKRLPPPAGVPLDEYGHGALIVRQDWRPAESLFCGRERAQKRVANAHLAEWVSAVVEVLDPSSHPPCEVVDQVEPIRLRDQQYFDESFLAMVLCMLLPEVDGLDELPLGDAIARIDESMSRWQLEPQGDVRWTQSDGLRGLDLGVRLYTGAKDASAAIVAARGSFEVVFTSELENGRWIVTGLADELDRRIMRVGALGLPEPHPVITLTTLDEPIEAVRSAHWDAIADEAVLAAPASLDEAIASFRRLMAAAR